MGKKVNKSKHKLLASIWKALRNRLHFRHLLFLGIILATNTFAWYIYMEKISSDIDVKVKAWNVSFRLDNQQMEDYINFSVNDIYPGMTTQTQTLSVTNDGEVDAQLYYELVSITVFGSTYTTDDGVTSEADLQNIMLNNYPFRITITTNQGTITRNGGTAMFYINVSWPYESTNSLGESNDALDTYWGNQAYVYKTQHPTLPCIKVRIKLSAIQVNEGNSSGTQNNSSGTQSGSSGTQSGSSGTQNGG